MDLPIERVAHGARPVGGENLFFDQKFTSDQKCSIFFEICAEVESFSTILLQGSLSQDVEGIGPFSSFECLGQPSLDIAIVILTFL